MKVTYQDDTCRVEHHPARILVIVYKCRGCPYKRQNATVCGKTGDDTNPEAVAFSCPLPTAKP